MTAAYGCRKDATCSAALTSFDRGGPVSLAEETEQLPSGAVIPSPRVGGRCLAADASGLPTLAVRLQAGDPIQDGAIERGQFLGWGIRLHMANDGPWHAACE